MTATAFEIYQAFEPFYEEIISFLDDMFPPSQLYRSTEINHLVKRGKKTMLNKRFRAIYEATDDGIREYKKRISYIESLYYRALEQIDDKYDPNNKPKLPIYVPRIFEDENLVKIQIHKNRAHSSKNYKPGELLPLISVSSDEEPSDEMKGYMSNLEELGYKPKLIYKDKIMTLNADVSSICNDYGCDSLQLRTATGNQIRASFFTEDEEGFLNKSKLSSVGILIVPKNVTVIVSNKRSIRTDAKFTKQHPDEIVFDFIPNEIISGRIYQVNK